MAIYHLEAKVVSRGTGRSAVAASAYLSCTNILNDYDGVRHDYTRKKGLIWREVFLPEYTQQDRFRSALRRRKAVLKYCISSRRFPFEKLDLRGVW